MIALFFDGANIHATAKALAVDIDYKKVRAYFGPDLLRAYYYTALLPRQQEEVSIIPLIDWLQYNGYTIVSKEAKEFVDAQGKKKVKGNMDIDMTVDVLEMSGNARVTDIWLFTGDGDFAPLVKAVQRQGVRVTVVSTISVNPPMIADELRRAADVFMDLAEMKQLTKPYEKKSSSRYA